MCGGGGGPKIEYRASTTHQTSPLHHCVPMSGWNEYKNLSNFRSGHRGRGCVWLHEVAIMLYCTAHKYLDFDDYTVKNEQLFQTSFGYLSFILLYGS